ncbi:MAG: ribonuclease [Sphingomonadales bacterium]|nr:MAG: ribonuclease [Sphingomonadales bacterium]
MAEWLIEEGIGESRALLVDKGEAKAAKLYWPGEIYAGLETRGQLTAKPAGAKRGTVQLEHGTEALIDHLPMDITEGKTIGVRISRAPLHERGRFKRAIGRYVAPGELSKAPANPFPEGKVVRRFPDGLWEEVWSTASSGVIEFHSGQILACATPAMTLIDIDGADNPGRTASAAVTAVAQAIHWFDLGGSIGIDFPTIQSKADRKHVDSLIDTALADWPHERTAMNGFGFVQIVARLAGPSLLHRFATSRTGMCARMALRRAEIAEGTGRILLLTVHPALKAKLKPDWLDELSRGTGREVRIETDPGLALEAAQAQIMAS